MPSPSEIAAKFLAIDAHDETVEGFRFIPALKRGAKAKVEVTLYRYWEKRRRVITFNDCQNFHVALDSTVLTDNSPCNTCVLHASDAQSEIVALMRKHKKTWNVSYQKPLDPLANKMSASENYVLFSVKMFGGVLQVIARSFTNRRVADAEPNEKSA